MGNKLQGKKKRFVKLGVNEISLVDEGANEEEEFLTVKQKQKGESQMGDLFDDILGDEESTPDETGEAPPEETETDKGKRVTSSRIGKLRKAAEMLMDLVAELDKTPEGAAKKETDKLRAEIQAEFKTLTEKLDALEGGKSEGNAEADGDAEETETDKLNMGKVMGMMKSLQAMVSALGKEISGDTESKKSKSEKEKAADEKDEDDDKGKSKSKAKSKGETEKTKTDEDDTDEESESDKRGASKSEPDNGEDQQTEKNAPSGSVFQPLFGGTGIGRTLAKQRHQK